MKKNYLLYIAIIAAAVIARILPHEWNFAPVTGVAIFAAMYLPLRHAVGLTLGIRLISDALIGFFFWPQMIAVYACHLLGIGLGLWVRRHKSLGRLLVAPVITAVVFFLITNHAWLYSISSYTHDWSGVMLAYTNGLPFLRGTLLGDLFYTLTLVGAYEAVRLYQRTHARRATRSI